VDDEVVLVDHTRMLVVAVIGPNPTRFGIRAVAGGESPRNLSLPVPCTRWFHETQRWYNGNEDSSEL
jgi:hypothetical protein